MALTTLNSTRVTREALMVLENEMGVSQYCNRQYDSRFGSGGGKDGASLLIRKPQRAVVRVGTTYSSENTTEDSVTLTVGTTVGCDLDISDADLALNVADFRERILRPRMSQLATYIDMQVAGLYNEVAAQVGTAGTTPATESVLLDAHRVMDEAGATRDSRYLVVDPAANVGLVAGMAGRFNGQVKITEQMTKAALANNYLGFREMTMSQNIRKHTVGPLGGTPLVNGATQTGSSLVTDGWTAAAAARLNKGDVFTLPTVFAVNPQTRESTGQLQKFVVMADVSSNGSGQATISIFPPIVTSGALMTVTNSPADNVALTIIGTAATAYPMNLAFQKDAFALVTADLEIPKSADMAARERHNGISMRFCRDWDIDTGTFKNRFDILFGVKCIRPELACRIIG